MTRIIDIDFSKPLETEIGKEPEWSFWWFITSPFGINYEVERCWYSNYNTLNSSINIGHIL